MGITLTIIRTTAITDHIRTMVTIMGLHSIGTADIGIITATIVTTIIITGNKVT